MLAVGLALGAALSWGCGDFIGGRAARTLHVLNEKETGPPREGAGSASALSAVSPAANSALNFIVGNEQVQTAARIEMIRFTF